MLTTDDLAALKAERAELVGAIWHSLASVLLGAGVQVGHMSPIEIVRTAGDLLRSGAIDVSALARETAPEDDVDDGSSLRA